MDELYPEFGRLLQRARKNANLSQEGLAARVGLTRTSISNLEAGRQRLRLDTVYLLAEVLGIAPHDLLPEPNEGRGAHDVVLSEVDELRRDWARRVLEKADQAKGQAT